MDKECGPVLIKLKQHKDERGYFCEIWRKDIVPFRPKQWNISYSKYGVLRGIHTEPWDKYIHVPYGKVFAAIVDLRKNHYGKVYTYYLSKENALYVPKGFGNSYLVTSKEAIYCYLVPQYWKDYKASGVAYDTWGIKWPIPKSKIILSKRDKNYARKNSWSSDS